MLNVFGNYYGWNFRTILSCCQLHHRLPFLDYIIKQTTILIFWVIFYWILNVKILNIDIVIANLIKVKRREKQTSLVTNSKTVEYKKVVRYRQHFTSNLIIHCKSHTGWVRRTFLVYLFVCMFALIYLTIQVE